MLVYRTIINITLASPVGKKKMPHIPPVVDARTDEHHHDARMNITTTARMSFL